MRIQYTNAFGTRKQINFHICTMVYVLYVDGGILIPNMPTEIIISKFEYSSCRNYAIAMQKQKMRWNYALE